MTDFEKFQLDNLQSIINRIEGNCFTLKSLAITITAASIAFVSTLNSKEHLVLYSICFLILVFWHLDARYLSQGRKFRKKQNDFLKQMEAPGLDGANNSGSLISTLFSWSVLWFYSALLVLVAAVLYAVGG